MDEIFKSKITFKFLATSSTKILTPGAKKLLETIDCVFSHFWNFLIGKFTECLWYLVINIQDGHNICILLEFFQSMRHFS